MAAANTIKSFGGLFFLKNLNDLANFENSSFFGIFSIGSILYIGESSGNVFIQNCRFHSNFNTIFIKNICF